MDDTLNRRSLLAMAGAVGLGAITPGEVSAQAPAAKPTASEPSPGELHAALIELNAKYAELAHNFLRSVSEVDASVRKLREPLNKLVDEHDRDGKHGVLRNPDDLIQPWSGSSSLESDVERWLVRKSRVFANRIQHLAEICERKYGF